MLTRKPRNVSPCTYCISPTTTTTNNNNNNTQSVSACVSPRALFSLDLEVRVVARFLGPAAVDHERHVIDRNRSFGDVGRKHDLPLVESKREGSSEEGISQPQQYRCTKYIIYARETVGLAEGTNMKRRATSTVTARNTTTTTSVSTPPPTFRHPFGGRTKTCLCFAVGTPECNGRIWNLRSSEKCGDCRRNSPSLPARNRRSQGATTRNKKSRTVVTSVSGGFHSATATRKHDQHRAPPRPHHKKKKNACRQKQTTTHHQRLLSARRPQLQSICPHSVHVAPQYPSRYRKPPPP